VDQEDFCTSQILNSFIYAVKVPTFGVKSEIKYSDENGFHLKGSKIVLGTLSVQVESKFLSVPSI
jgi:hypothetical protein